MIQEERATVSSITGDRAEHARRSAPPLSTAGTTRWSLVAGLELAVVEVNAYVVVVEVGGEHDLAHCEETKRLLLRLVDAYDVVIIDLSTALFIDSSFIVNLEHAATAARARGTRFRVHLGAASTCIRRTLEITTAFRATEQAHETPFYFDPGAVISKG